MPDSGIVFTPAGRIVDVAGATVPGGTIEFYSAGTSAPKAVYSDRGLTTSLGATVYLDSGGHPVSSQGSSTKVLVYTGSALIKMIVKDANGTTLATYDNVQCAIDTSTFGTGTGTGGAVASVVSRTSDYTIVDADDAKLFNCDPTGGEFTLTLPSAATVGDGYEIGIRHAGTTTTNVVKVASVSNQTIALDGSSMVATALTGGGEELWLTSNGGGWVGTAHTPPKIVGNVSFFTLEDRRISPPTSPVTGGYYLINGTPTGAWSAFAANDIVRADGQSNWVRWSPVEDCGWLAYLKDENITLQYTGTSWLDWSNVAGPTATPLRMMLIRNSQATSATASTYATGAWNTLTFQTLEFNTILTSNGATTDAALSANTLILPTGKYLVDFEHTAIIASGNTSAVVRGRINNISTGSFYYSETEQVVAPASPATSGSVKIRVKAVVVITAATETLRFELRCTNTVTGGVVLGLATVNEQFGSVVVTDITAQQGPRGARGLQGALGPGYAATSTSTITVATGSISLTTQVGLAYSAGQRVRVARTSDPINYYMVGSLTSYDTITGEMSVTVDKSVGSGSYSAWSIGVDGEIGYPGTTVPDISGLSETTSVNDEVDYTIVYDVAASAHKKAKNKNLGFTANGGTLRTLQSKLREWKHASDYSSINVAVTAIGSTPTTMVVSTACTLTASLTIPSTMTLAFIRGGSIAKAAAYTLTINGRVVGPDLSTIFTGFAVGDVTLSAAQIVYPEWWGAAVGGAASTNKTAIQSALSAITSGGIVELQGGIYSIDDYVAITKNLTTFRGQGRNQTYLSSTSATADIIRVVGTLGSPISHPVIDGISTTRSVTGTGGIGIKLQFTSVAKVANCQIIESKTGMYLEAAGTSNISRVLSSFSGSTSGYVGFELNGANGGNISTAFLDCAATSSSGGGSPTISSSSSYGWKCYGTNVADLTLTNCDTSFTSKAASFDFSTASAGSEDDIVLNNCHWDYFDNVGLEVTGNTDDMTGVQMNGGWIDAQPVAGNTYGAKITNTRGVVLNGVEFYIGNFDQNYGVHATSADNVKVLGCHFDANWTGVYFTGCADSVLANNTFNAPVGKTAAAHIDMRSASRVNIIGNALDGYATVGLSIDASCSKLVVMGNSADTTHLTALSDASGTTLYGKNANINGAYPVDGPTSHTDAFIPQWNGTDTHVLKEGLQFDTAGTLASNSDTRIASQKAVKTYVDGKVPTAYSSYTPTVSADSGAITGSTITSANYYDVGAMRTYQFSITLGTLPGGQNYMKVTLPSSGTLAEDLDLRLGRNASTNANLKVYGFSGQDHFRIIDFSTNLFPGVATNVISFNFTTRRA